MIPLEPSKIVFGRTVIGVLALLVLLLWKAIDLITMVAVVFGLYMVVPNVENDANILEGMYWGILSAFLFAILSLTNSTVFRSSSYTSSEQPVKD